MQGTRTTAVSTPADAPAVPDISELIAQYLRHESRLEY
jgi:hypothetical protein